MADAGRSRTCPACQYVYFGQPDTCPINHDQPNVTGRSEAWAYCDDCGQYRAVIRFPYGERRWEFQELCRDCGPTDDASEPTAKERLQAGFARYEAKHPLPTADASDQTGGEGRG